MSSAPNLPNIPAPPSGSLPQRPSYLGSNAPDPDMIRQQINQSGGRMMPPMPGFQGGPGFDPNTDPNFLASQKLLQQKGINVPSPQGGGSNTQGLPPLPPIGADGSWQGNVPPPQPMGGIPMSALGIPAYKPGMDPRSIQPPSQDQMDQLRDLINQSIAAKQLSSPNVSSTSQ